MSDIVIEENLLESERFGIKCAKIFNLNSENIGFLGKLINAHEATFYSVRISVDHIDIAHKLEQLGFEIMDTLLYYRKSNLKSVSNFDSEFQFRLSNSSDAQEILSLARRVFKGYFGHYHADSRFPKNLCDEVYADWAYNSCLSVDPTIKVILALYSNTPVGFAIMKKIKNYSDGLLFGVDPEYRGRGLYRQLVKKALLWTEEQGVDTMIYSSQINNHAANKIWAQEGGEMFQAFYTFHLWKN